MQQPEKLSVKSLVVKKRLAGVLAAILTTALVMAVALVLMAARSFDFTLSESASPAGSNDSMGPLLIAAFAGMLSGLIAYFIVVKSDRR